MNKPLCKHLSKKNKKWFSSPNDLFDVMMVFKDIYCNKIFRQRMVNMVHILTVRYHPKTSPGQYNIFLYRKIFDILCSIMLMRLLITYELICFNFQKCKVK